MSAASYYKNLANDANAEECSIIFELIEKASKRGLYSIQLDSKTVEMTENKIVYLRQLGFYVCSGAQCLISWQN